MTFGESAFQPGKRNLPFMENPGSGMFSRYHLIRWIKFFNGIELAMQKNEDWNRSQFYIESCEWEKEWSKKTDLFSTEPIGDPVSTVQDIWSKYAVYFE